MDVLLGLSDSYDSVYVDTCMCAIAPMQVSTYLVSYYTVKQWYLYNELKYSFILDFIILIIHVQFMIHVK